MDLFIKTVAYRNAPTELTENARRELKACFPSINFRFVSENADVIFFLNGGSEHEAIKSMISGRYYLLLAGYESNAWAAATEVKAWADNKKIPSSLVSMQEAAEGNILNDFARTCEALDSLRGKQAGLIGNVSHWLVASAFPLSLAKDRFGINIKHLQWGKLPDYLSFDPSPEFLSVYNASGNQHFENEARVFAFLQSLLNEHHLSGITLECFDMVNDRAVTACLSLALLNSKGIVAGCEGDLVSLVGMMLVQAITGAIPWMANVVSLNDQSVLFAHCTAPLHLLNDYKINTHFETGKSAAVQGKLNMDEVSLFRLSQDLNRAFIANGRIISQPEHEHACRTQSLIELRKDDVDKLRNAPLGNHHLIIPGNVINLLEWLCRYKQIEII